MDIHIDRIRVRVRGTSERAARGAAEGLAADVVRRLSGGALDQLVPPPPGPGTIRAGASAAQLRAAAARAVVNGVVSAVARQRDSSGV